MKKQPASNKLAKKKQTWIERTSRILNITEARAETLLQTNRRQSIRLNTLRATVDDLPNWVGKPYPWMANGYELLAAVADIRDDEHVSTGDLFIQNAASWLPVLALAPQAGDRVLDVCAAPGGKTSHIAAITNNKARITVNDNSRPRLAKLRANLERLGVVVEQYTLYDATMLARKLEGQQFDRILIDAPCSGEGLMNITRDKDFASWSVAHIKRLQQLQKRILTQAWRLLAPGGTLVYSTCTMAPEEDEAVIDYLLRSREDATIIPFKLQLPNRMPVLTTWNGKAFNPALAGCMRLKPSEAIEAFFVCALHKKEV